MVLPGVAALSDEEEEPPGHDVVLAPLDRLSDDENHQCPDHEQAVVARANTQGCKRKRMADAELIAQESRTLQRVVQSKCSCKDPSCRHPWKSDPALLHALLTLRVDIKLLPKLESDAKACGIMLCKKCINSRVTL